jgi:hypothetical protein
MSIARALALATAATLALPYAVAAHDAGFAAASTRAAADAADEQLVQLRRAVWSSLDPAQRTAFAQRERAWLNGGRDADQRHCVNRASEPTTLVVEQCRLSVAQQHKATLASPAVQARAGR